MKTRGQISIEYLVVIGFVTFLIISILGLAFFYASGTRDRIRVNQVTAFASKVISSSESVYYSGEPSKLTVRAYLPAGVQDVQIVENDLIIKVVTGSGITTMAFSSDVPISGDLSETEGVKRIEVIAQENGVYFEE